MFEFEEEIENEQVMTRVSRRREKDIEAKLIHEMLQVFRARSEEFSKQCTEAQAFLLYRIHADRDEYRRRREEFNEKMRRDFEDFLRREETRKLIERAKDNLESDARYHALRERLFQLFLLLSSLLVAVTLKDAIRIQSRLKEEFNVDTEVYKLENATVVASLTRPHSAVSRREDGMWKSIVFV